MPLAVLMGPPGSGKSSIGKALAKELGTTFIDTDLVIESVSNRTIPQIFSELGESGFREVEQEVVLGVLASEPGIVALGGGSILSEAVRQVLRTARFPVIYVEVSAHQAIARVSKQGNRPLLADDPAQQWRSMMELRRPIYEELGDLHFFTDSKKPVEIAKEIAAEINKVATKVEEHDEHR